MLAPHVPDASVETLADLVAQFRVLYPTIAVAPTPAFDGAHESLAAVRRHGGRTLVVTGKFTPNARLHVEALGLDVDHVVGEVWGPGKGPVLAEHGAALFVGDHVHDIEGAHAAGVVGVGVTTGGCKGEELRRRERTPCCSTLADSPPGRSPIWPPERHSAGTPGLPSDTPGAPRTGGRRPRRRLRGSA